MIPSFSPMQRPRSSSPGSRCHLAAPGAQPDPRSRRDGRDGGRLLVVRRPHRAAGGHQRDRGGDRHARTALRAEHPVAAFCAWKAAVARPQWVPRRSLLLALLIEPVLITVAAVTNPWHQLVYRGAGAAQLTGQAEWSYGPVFWVDAWFTYAEMVIGLGPLPGRGGLRRRPSAVNGSPCSSPH